MQDLLKNLPGEFYKRTFILLSILIGLAINVYIVQKVVSLSTRAAVSNVEFYFTPETATIPPDTTFKLMLNPGGQSISFVQVHLYFNNEVLELSGDVSLGSALTPVSVLNSTAIAVANQTGEITLIMTQDPGSPAPSQAFELATMPFTFVGSGTETATDITIVDEDTQVVNASSESLSFTTRYASVNSTNVTPPKGFMAMAAPLAKMFQGECPELHLSTAVGCVPYSDSQAMATFFLAFGMGIGGGIALILIVFGSYQIMSSGGDPKKVESGKALITSAVMGLVMLVFSAYILNFVGVDLLGIL